MKIMQSEIDKMIQEEYEDYEFLNEVRKPEKEASMRIAKTRVKEIIQEELNRFNAAESQDVDEGFMSGIRFRAGQKKKEPTDPWDMEALKSAVRDAVVRSNGGVDSTVVEILKVMDAVYEASWKPTKAGGEELPNLGIDPTSLFLEVKAAIRPFFGEDMVKRIMGKLEPNLEAMEADNKERLAALSAQFRDGDAENF